MKFSKTRLRVLHGMEQSRTLLGRFDARDVQELVHGERAFYSWQNGIQAVEDAAGTVVAVFQDGTVYITHITEVKEN